MSKHRLSPAPLPPAKRQHARAEQKISSSLLLNFDASLYDELVLVIFSHLSWTDLCAIQPINRHWARLATDNQLWKAQFIREYGRLRLRGSRGFVTRRDGREVKPMPHRSKEDDHIDWKWMFRISSNWRKGRCELEKFVEPTISPSSLRDALHSCTLLAGPLTFTTSSEESPSPPVYLHRRDSAPYMLKGKHRANTSTRITTLALDQSPPSLGDSTLRIAAFYDTGEFTIFSIDHGSPQHSRKSMSYCPYARNERTSPIRQAVYHHPLLITLSQSFHLSLYNLSSGTIVHSQTLTSFTSFLPTSMVLTPGSGNYRLVLAYSAPVYPAHWNAAVTVLTIASCESATSGASPSRDDALDSARPCTVIATQTVRSYDVPSGWIDEKALRLMQEQWGRKVARVADTQTDGKWMVLAPADRLPLSSSRTTHSSIGTTSCALQLYRLYLPSSLSSTRSGTGKSLQSSGSLRMTFVRMLHGHTGPVIAVAVADGRCVSLGADGSLWVWDLEKGWGVEVQAPHRAVRAGPYSSEHDGEDAAADVFGDGEVPMGTPLGAVVFDERRIVTADAYGIEARRFDI
ncbi:hypothetical protein M0805_006323 [Coniferiporia weirii]|nr:hypothetical protein M0805_006323 [Coniferiporia weirii]